MTCAFLFHTVVAALSHLVTPVIFPATSRKLDAQPGMRAYWDSSVASTLVGVLNPAFAAWIMYKQPGFFTAADGAPFMASPETCRGLGLFLAWCFWETVFQLYNWGLWPGGRAMLVHHFSAIVAWGLYLSGGYGHAISLVGMLCEATNPFMNMRWFFSELELKDHALYTANGVLFLLSWLVFRVLFALPVGLYLIYAQMPGLLAAGVVWWRLALYVLFFGTGCVLNLMWGQKLLAGALKMLKPDKPKTA